MVAILAVEGHVPPSDVLGDELTWEESSHLASAVQRQVTERVKAEVDLESQNMKAILEGIGAVQSSIHSLNKNIVKAFSR